MNYVPSILRVLCSTFLYDPGKKKMMYELISFSVLLAYAIHIFFILTKNTRTGGPFISRRTFLSRFGGKKFPFTEIRRDRLTNKQMRSSMANVQLRKKEIALPRTAATNWILRVAILIYVQCIADRIAKLSPE